MKQKKIILVTGATGAQGGSVAEALLLNQKFDVRILTRDADSEKARALQAAGAEVAVGDFENIESLREALKGVYAVFGVTNYWEHFDKEFKHGKNLIDAVQYSGVKHLVYSSLPHYHKLSNGTLNVPPADMKALLQEYAKSLKIPSTFVQVAFYYENFLNFFPLQRDNHNNLHFGFPQGDAKLSMVSVTDLGGVVATIFDHPVEYTGRTVVVVGEDRTCAEYAHIMSKVLQRNVYYTHIPRRIYAKFDFPAAGIWANTFEAQRLYISNRQLNLIESYGLNPAMQTFEKWLIKNKDKFNTEIKTPQETAVA